ncbi:MAG: hypothetical protein ACTHL8_05365 [Burkholderiaceae bacterium]
MTDEAALKKRGGARPGAGRPVKAHLDVEPGTEALDFLRRVFESSSVPMPLRVTAARAVVAATIGRPGDVGKKAAASARAAELMAAGGPFSPRRPPRLVASGGRSE